jgi:excisionase family DNA binding protein
MSAEKRERVFLSMWEVARRLDVSISRAYALTRAGAIPHIRRGRAVRVPKGAFDAWVAGQEREALAALRAAHAETATG